jgi:hypothetical protein
MANTIEITKDFPASRERTVLLELLNVMKTLKQAQIEVVICGGWVPFLKELARHVRRGELARHVRRGENDQRSLGNSSHEACFSRPVEVSALLDSR